MTVQSDFDDLYTFATAIAPALEAVAAAWAEVIEDEADALAAIDLRDEEGNDLWTSHLDGLAYTFTADNEPAGLTEDQQIAWNDRADDIEYKAKRRIRQRANRLQTNIVANGLHVVLAKKHLNAARAMFVARDIWSSEWVMFLVLGVYHGHMAGGADAFSVQADKTLYGQARTLLVNNAERCLEVFDLSRDQWPSDSTGVAEYRAARNALAAFIG